MKEMKWNLKINLFKRWQERRKKTNREQMAQVDNNCQDGSLSPTISIIIFNGNGLNRPTESRDGQTGQKKRDPSICFS